MARRYRRVIRNLSKAVEILTTRVLKQETCVWKSNKSCNYYTGIVWIQWGEIHPAGLAEQTEPQRQGRLKPNQRESKCTLAVKTSSGLLKMFWPAFRLRSFPTVHVSSWWRPTCHQACSISPAPRTDPQPISLKELPLCQISWLSFLPCRAWTLLSWETRADPFHLPVNTRNRFKKLNR